jgi:hypothetical protein
MLFGRHHLASMVSWLCFLLYMCYMVKV